MQESGVKVEYRFLQLILSPVSDDKVTLGLLHWDGTELRVAYSFEPLSTLEKSFRETVKRTVTALMRRASQVSKELLDKPTLNAGLKHVFQVRDGFGASLLWSPIRSLAIESDPLAHFEELRRQVRLAEEPHRRHRWFTANDLRRRVLSTGESLQSMAPEAIKVDHEVGHLQEYISPLSWKNGAWHHVIPFSLDGMDKAEMDSSARDLYGLVQLAIPKSDTPVVLTVLPESARLAKVAEEETAALIRELADRNVEIQRVRRSGRNVELIDLRDRILRDIRHQDK